MKTSQLPALSDLFVFTCGALFLFSALDKVAEHEKFHTQVGKSPLLTGYEDWVTWAVPAVEVLITVAMVRTKSRMIGLYGFFTLMMVFIGYIILLTNMDANVPCGCNFLTEKMGPAAHVVMNLVFAGMTTGAIIIEERIN